MRDSNGDLFYLTLTIDEDYYRFCTERLAASGLAQFRVTKVKQVLYLDGENYQGYVTKPDRVFVSFAVEDRSGASREIRITHFLSESARTPAPRSSKLSDSAKAAQYAELVAEDLRRVADELVQRLKDA